MRRPLVLAHVAAAASVAAVVGGLLSAVASSSSGGLVLLLAFSAVGGIVVAMGAFVARREPDNWVGAVLALMGLVAILVLGVDPIVAKDPPSAYVIAAREGAWVWLYVPVGVLLAIFPTGRPVNRAGRVVVVGLPVLATVFNVLAAFPVAPYVAPNESLPHALPESLVATVAAYSCVPVLMGLLVTAAVSMRQRYRCSDPKQRAQVRWLAVAGVGLPLTLLICWLSYALLGTADLVIVGLVFIYLAVPAAATVAIVRHDLYDVDDALIATLAYGAMAAVLIAAFTAASIVSGLVLGQDSVVIAVCVTAAVAFLLGALRERVQGVLARRVFPARERARRALNDLSARVRDGTGRPEQTVEVLADALRDPGLEMRYAGSGPVLGSLDPTPVLLGDTLVGHLVAGPGRRRVPREVADQAAMLLETARLRTDLADALTEVESSRERVLAAGYDERRRLERDLHDGAQQRLVSLGMSLRLLQRALPEGDHTMRGELDGAVAQIATAVAELRQLAHGIRPGSLDDGLGAALSNLASTTAVPLQLEIRGLNGDADELGEVTGTTAYFVAAEAVTNAVRYAGAGSISVSVRREGHVLRVGIVDNGCGGAHSRPGSGLSGLTDRVAAAGGRLTVSSPVDGGTSVEAVLPCGS